MTHHRCGRLIASCTLFASLFTAAVPAEASNGAAEAAARAQFVREARAMMLELQPVSRADSAKMRAAYRPYLAEAMLRDRSMLTAALEAGDVAPLPEQPLEYNIQPRLTGASPIGEKDLEHQHLYVAARPETLGLLMQIAARVTSAPLEVTSMVRHEHYQRSLARTNANASTAVPTHTMGLAVDISILNTPLSAAREIRDVLLDMRADGDLLVIAEVNQLVFHVVPTPNRLEYFRSVYTVATEMPPPLLPKAPRLPAPAAVELDSEVLAASAVPAARPWHWALALIGAAGMLWTMRRLPDRRRQRAAGHLDSHPARRRRDSSRE